MNFAKTFVAILASFLLVGTQSVSAIGQKGSSSESQVCRCCDCNKTSCCIAKSDSTPQPIPPAPVRTVSQNNLQMIAAVVSVLLPASDAPAAQIFFPPSASFAVTSIPLYEWNCSYLI